MPTYSYACTECDNKFDIVQSFSDDSLTECPQCTGRLRKLFNSVGIVFKGSGFYRTDSRSGSSSSDTASSSSSDSSSSSTSSASSDSSSSSSSSTTKSDSKAATPA
ncbi:FmdB family zinc ribbon protein [Gordonia rubripertincta]|uniref:Zinc ribbon domain-containing protein n=2 Tax=Gordonia rubripertincta TaxID=36822 RepID=A0AAW6R7B2_GORRU|nr:FmdB family zinc ribbon protein [Gordonia rubripertincta]MDG6780461.1 zinc ribbon domain-containing protein [Gordonia rubripertincta]NKY64152.1 FmdB family transcriptional regulator [Gordonia rubripertincta]GAB83388.1 putative FmdB family regulatory protein [Gordonia rubripertincta NBRC 101908]